MWTHWTHIVPLVCREMRLFTLCVILILYGKSVSCVVRQWLPTTNVLHRENWEANSKGCKGLFFPKSTNYPMAMDSLTVSEIVLPLDGGMVLNQGATVTLDPKNETCIKLKQPEPKSWVDPKNWDPLPNKAIPYLDRFPCDNDEAYFMKDSSYDVYIPQGLRYGLIAHVHNMPEKYQEEIGLASGRFYMNCQPPWGCFCHIDPFITCEFVGAIELNKAANCVDPVMSPGQCQPTCGAYFSLSQNSRRPKIMKIEKFLEDNSENVDFHISRRHEGYQINLVDKDKDNSGYYSLKLAKELSALLSDENSKLFIKNFKLVTSGHPRSPTFILDMFTFIFGAFLTTVVMFVVIFVVYEKYNLEINLPWMKKAFIPFVFVKFENKEGGGLTLSRASVTSLVSLEKSFDNPMFGTDLPSTSSGFYALQKNEDEEEAGEEATELQDYSKELQQENSAEEVENLD